MRRSARSLISPATVAVMLESTRTVQIGERILTIEDVPRCPIEDGYACVGDVLFIAPVEGRYTRWENGGTGSAGSGRLIVEGELRGVLRSV